MPSYRRTFILSTSKLIHFPRLSLLCIAFSTLLLAACGGSSDLDSEVSDSDQLVDLVIDLGLTGNAASGRDIPSIEEPIAQLGKHLFFTKGLGGDRDSACVTCHHPVLGGGDNLSLSIGVGGETDDLLGIGRFHDSQAEHYDGGPTVPRNAPTTFNIALWDKFLFHDGRVESLGKTAGANGDDAAGIRTPDSTLGVADPNAGQNMVEAQARFPVTSAEEMRGFVFAAGASNAEVRTALEARFTAGGEWDEAFTEAFGEAEITYARIAQAISDYERSQLFVETPFKAFVEGDASAMSEEAIRGALFFFQKTEDGGANCASCHSGDFFSDEGHHVTASPQIGRGKGNDNGVTQNDDFGRFRETGGAADMYRFRTPSLLNVEVTGPWGHAGGNTTLEGAIRHSLNPREAIASYDFAQLEASIQASDMATNTQFALDQLEVNRNNAVPNVLQNVSFTDQNVSDLVEFMKALTDPCVKDRACLAAWIAEDPELDVDGLRVNAIDESGSAL